MLAKGACGGVVYLAYCHLQGWLGPATWPERKAPALLVATLLTLLPLAMSRERRRSLPPLLALAGFWGASADTATLWFAVWATVFVVVLSRAVGAGLLITTAFEWLAKAVPMLQALPDITARGVTRLAGEVSRGLLGPTILVLWPLLAFLAIVLCCAVQARSWRVGLWSLAGLLVAWGWWSFVPAAVREASTLEVISVLPRTGSIALGALLLLVLLVSGGPSGSRGGPPALRHALAAGLVGGLIGTAHAWAAAAEPRPVVGVVNEGGIDWKRPRLDVFGPRSSGMFGLLPLYLQQDGYSFEVVDLEDPDGLAGIDILLLINCPRLWSAGEIERVSAFLEGGGGLLALADHTNVFEQQAGMNSLLGTYGITLSFDSAYPMDQNWERVVTMDYGPVTDAGDTPFELGHSIGASLDVSPGVHRAVVARYAFSDVGRANNIQGAYLGDYTYSADEDIGDRTIVAWTAIGRGKVVVYGDTSAFQNSSLSETYASHVLPAFRWLSSSDSSIRTVAASFIGGTLLAAALLALTGSRKAGPLLVVATAAAIVHDGTVWRLRRMPTASRLHALVDTACMPWIGHPRAMVNYVYPWDSICQRMGLLPLHCDPSAYLEDGLTPPPAAVAIVAPRLELSAEDVDDIVKYVESGGLVLVCADGERGWDAAGSLLDAFGVHLAGYTLGPVPPRSAEHDYDPRNATFVDAWPIATTTTGARTLFGIDEQALAVEVPRGKGSLVAVGDARWLSTRNIEGEWGYSAGNVTLLAAILESGTGAKPTTAMSPLLETPGEAWDR